GPTDDSAVNSVRKRQIKNYLATTLLSLGMPMIMLGDEMRRTQSGNNNAYCQDNEISWLDWTFREPYADIHRFVAQLTGRRVRCDWGSGVQGITLNEVLKTAAKTWHGVRLGHPDWSDSSHTLA